MGSRHWSEETDDTAAFERMEATPLVAPETGEPQEETVDWEAVDNTAFNIATGRDQYQYPKGVRDEGNLGGPGEFAWQAQGAVARPVAAGLDFMSEKLGGDPEHFTEMLTRGGTIPPEGPTTSMGRMGETAGEMGVAAGAGGLAMQVLALQFPALATVAGGGNLTQLLERMVGPKLAGSIGDFVPSASRAVFGPMQRQARTVVEGGKAAVKRSVPPEVLMAHGLGAAGAGVGAGVGGETARAVGLPEHVRAAELAGSLPGAMAAIVGPRAVTGAVKEGLSSLSRRIPGVRDIPALKARGDKFRLQQATNEANRLMRRAQNTPEENLRRIQGAREVQESLPGTEFNTAQATGDLAYKTKISDLTRHKPEYSGRIQRMQERTQEALKGHMEDAAPDQATGAELLKRRVQEGYNAELNAMDTKIAQIEQGVQSKLQQVGEKADYSDELARVVNEEVVPWRTAKGKELYDPLEALGDRLRLPMARIQHAVQTEYAKLADIAVKDLGKLPNAIQNIIDAPPNSTQTFGELRALSVSMNRNIRQLERSGENDTAVYLLRQVKGTLKDSMDDMRDSGEFLTEGVDAQQVKAMWQAADEFWRKSGDIVQRGITGRISGKGAGGQIAPSDAARKLASPTGENYRGRAQELDALKRYMRAEGLTEQADAIDSAVRGYLTRDAYDTVGFGVEGKTVKASNLNQWRKTNSEMLKQHPEVDRQLADVEKAQRFFETEGVSHKTAVKTHSESLAAAFLKKDVGSAIEAVLDHPDPAKAAGQLLLEAGHNPEAKSGMMRAIYDNMMKKAYVEVVDEGLYSQAEGAPALEILDPARIAAFASGKKYEPLIRVLGGEKHLERWRTIMRSARRAKTTGASGVTRESPKDVQDANVVARHFYNRWANGKLSWFGDGSSAMQKGGRMAIDFAFEKFPNEVTTELMENALANPAFAETLLREMTPATEEAIRKAIYQKISKAPIVAGVMAESAQNNPTPTNQPERRD